MDHPRPRARPANASAIIAHDADRPRSWLVSDRLSAVRAATHLRHTASVKYGSRWIRLHFDDSRIVQVSECWDAASFARILISRRKRSSASAPLSSARRSLSAMSPVVGQVAGKVDRRHSTAPKLAEHTHTCPRRTPGASRAAHRKFRTNDST
jgi:hypothetical protein